MKILYWMVWFNIAMFAIHIGIGDYAWAGINGIVAVTFRHFYDEINRAKFYSQSARDKVK